MEVDYLFGGWAGMGWVATIIGAAIAAGASLLIALVSAGPSELRRAERLAELAAKYPDGAMKDELQARSYRLALEATDPSRGEINWRFGVAIALSLAMLVGGVTVFVVTDRPGRTGLQDELRWVALLYAILGGLSTLAGFGFRGRLLARRANRGANDSDASKADEPEPQSRPAGDNQR